MRIKKMHFLCSDLAGVRCGNNTTILSASKDINDVTCITCLNSMASVLRKRIKALKNADCGNYGCTANKRGKCTALDMRGGCTSWYMK